MINSIREIFWYLGWFLLALAAYPLFETIAVPFVCGWIGGRSYEPARQFIDELAKRREKQP